MRKSRFTEEKMVAVLRDANRTTVAEAAKKLRCPSNFVFQRTAPELPHSPWGRRRAFDEPHASDDA